MRLAKSIRPVAASAGVAIVAAALAVWLWPASAVTVPEENPVRPLYEHRARLFASLPTRDPGGTAFLGDSLVEWGNWPERWPGGAVARGLSGAKVREVGLCVPELARHRPATVVVMCGVNDLVAGRSPEAVTADAAALVRRLLAETGARVRLCGVLPVGEAWGDAPAGLNRRVAAVNAGLRQLAGGRVEFVDLAALADGGGWLRAELTCDGVHLTGAGYEAWARALGG